MSGTILIVDDVATNRIVLKVKLAEACYETLQADCGSAALQMAHAHQPDLILLDVLLPDMDGIEVCRRLKSDPATSDIPVVMITALNDTESRMRALQSGADEFLPKSHDEAVLLARLRSLLRARQTSEELRLRDTTWRELGFGEPAADFDAPGVIGLIAARKETALSWRRSLAGHLQDRMLVLGREDVLTEPGQHRQFGGTPEVFMIAADLVHSGDGLRLLSELRSRSSTRHAAICIVIEPGRRDIGAMALDLGANDLLMEGADPRETALRLTTQLRRKRQADRLRTSMRDGLQAAVTDSLTGLYNRRYAVPHLARIAERSRQTGRPFAVMVLDIDRFKLVNDTWGHATGDAVLVEFAARLRDHLRPGDLVARIGGEEFLVALPDAPLALARVAAERLCRVVQERPVQLVGGPQVAITLSIGLVIGGERGSGIAPDVQLLIDLADRAMLASKTEGRNQVTISRSAA